MLSKKEQSKDWRMDYSPDQKWEIHKWEKNEVLKKS